MQKIIVIGCPGAGKTTFAQKLAKKTGLPLFHLDAIWHKPDKTHISREEFDLHLAAILSQDAWIIDGDYSRTLEWRFLACDTVILFDLPTEVCIGGALSRLGQARPDMPWIDCVLDPQLKMQIEQYKTQNLPAVRDLILKYGQQKNVLVFHSREAAEEFLNEVN